MICSIKRISIQIILMDLLTILVGLVITTVTVIMTAMSQWSTKKRTTLRNVLLVSDCSPWLNADVHYTNVTNKLHGLQSSTANRNTSALVVTAVMYVVVHEL